MKQKLFVCDCNSVEHQIVITYFSDEEYGEIYCSIHLQPEPNFLKRIRNAVKYIFGHRSIYGDFDEFILNRKTPINYRR